MEKHINKVLSIDWDFFFPDLFHFDWGFRESPFFIEALWYMRAGNHNLKTGERAIDVVHPDPVLLEDFWNKVLLYERQCPHTLVISESHLDLYHLLRMIGPSHVVNFDAHHDLNYADDLNDTIDCSNWGAHSIALGLMIDYHIYYPPWRKERPEGVPEEFEIYINQNAKYGIPSYFQQFDAIFICRSGAWTPPWADDKWVEFVGRIKQINPLLWQKKTIMRGSLAPRAFDLQKALREADFYQDAIKQIIRMKQKA